MTRKLFRTLAGGILAAALSGLLPAATLNYTVTNLTLSGGDPTYSIATDVTFNNLALRENFSDGTGATVALFDFSGAARTSLSTATFNLTSGSLTTPDPLHGNVVSAVLTGAFSQTNFNIVTAFGASPVNVTVNSAFTATLPFASSSINILANSGAGASYAAGTLQSSLVNAPSVPEPATGAVAALGIAGLLLLGRRRLSHPSLNSQLEKESSL